LILQDNVLISSAGAPMLTDFGLSTMRAVSEYMSDTTGFKGTVRWMAIEFFPLHETSSGCMIKPNEKTDVWAFGMTVYVSSD
jgi:serine/threonine protein kinase